MRESEAMEKFSASPLVQSADLNYLRSATALPNDALYAKGTQWWAKDIALDQAIDKNLLASGLPVVLAVLDTGVHLTHEDLAGRFVPGADFVSLGGDGSVPDANPWNWHGTHVAGIAAALANNSLGIAGTASASQVKIMPIRILAPDGVDAHGNTVVSCSDATLIQSLVWAVDHGAKVVNMSLGGPGKSSALEAAVQYAHDHGCVLVAAAGNSAREATGTPPQVNRIMYPAAYDHVIGVAACDQNGFSTHYSEYNAFVDIAAPGGTTLAASEYIYSCVPYQWATDPFAPRYAGMAGTSMATPMVAGAAAMLMAQNPYRTPEEVESLITTTAEKTGTLAVSKANWDPFLGYGRVNVCQALQQGLSTEIEPAPSQGRAAYNYPNPFNPRLGDKTYIVIPLVASDPPASVHVNIYDIAGRLVRSLDFNYSDVYQGKKLEWDGRNDQGVRVANGIYPFVFSLGMKTYTNKIAVNNQ
jgi:subtilisin family serine protease